MRVIAVESFTDDTVTPPEFHPYGHEFEQKPGAKLDGWLRDGVVREDDRLAKSRAPQPGSEETGEATG